MKKIIYSNAHRVNKFKYIKKVLTKLTLLAGFDN